MIGALGFSLFGALRPDENECLAEYEIFRQPDAFELDGLPSSFARWRW